MLVNKIRLYREGLGYVFLIWGKCPSFLIASLTYAWIISYKSLPGSTRITPPALAFLNKATHLGSELPTMAPHYKGLTELPTMVPHYKGLTELPTRVPHYKGLTIPLLHNGSL